MPENDNPGGNTPPAGENGAGGAPGGSGAESEGAAALEALRAELAAAQSRVSELESAHTNVTAQLGEATSARTTAEAQIAEARAAHLEVVRRAVLAENAGSVVAELVQGDTPEAVEASVATAKAAFDRIAALVKAQAPAPLPVVGPGASASNPGQAAEGLAPMDKISAGLAARNGVGR